MERSRTGRVGVVGLLVAIMLALAGCGSVSGGLHSGNNGRSGSRVAPATDGEPPPAGVVLTQARDDEGGEDYDPWERFNEAMFTFNYNFDKYALKPVAKAYGTVIPEPFQVMVGNGFDNLRAIPRVINSLLQGKWAGAGREASRFFINSTAGIGGLFDPARNYWGIEKSDEDFGQTLGVWGAPAGPYLVLPFMTPMTVRDGLGRGVDGFLNPVNYVLPFVWDRIGMTVGDVVNDRSLNYELFQGFEESTLDMYSAVRDAYLRRRELMIRQ